MSGRFVRDGQTPAHTRHLFPPCRASRQLAVSCPQTKAFPACQSRDVFGGGRPLLPTVLFTVADKQTRRKYRVGEHWEFRESNAGLMVSSGVRIPKHEATKCGCWSAGAPQSDNMGPVCGDTKPSHLLVCSTNAHCNKEESKQTRPREQNKWMRL